jgi:hypothetical protein
MFEGLVAHTPYDHSGLQRTQAMKNPRRQPRANKYDRQLNSNFIINIKDDCSRMRILVELQMNMIMSLYLVIKGNTGASPAAKK